MGEKGMDGSGIWSVLRRALHGEPSVRLGRVGKRAMLGTESLSCESVIYTHPNIYRCYGST